MAEIMTYMTLVGLAIWSSTLCYLHVSVGMCSWGGVGWGGVGTGRCMWVHVSVPYRYCPFSSFDLFPRWRVMVTALQWRTEETGRSELQNTHFLFYLKHKVIGLGFSLEVTNQKLCMKHQQRTLTAHCCLRQWWLSLATSTEQKCH